MDETPPIQLLDPEGKLVPGAVPGIDDEFILEGLRWMLVSRQFDIRATALQRQGRLGVFSPVLGQEASVVGSAMCLDPSIDWLVPQYRELPAMLMHGFPLEKHLMNLTGNPVAGRIPDSVKMLPTQVALAAQFPHAVGLAWGLKIQKKEGIVMTYIGEGASSEGDFHEALNLAGVTGSPIVFFLQNNQWAISTPRRLQSAGRFADRALGYGFPGFQVDGNDLLAVQQVTSEAVARAREGHGPTLIESVTYRMSFHNTTDNPSKYQDPAELEAARLRDPIKRIQAYLRERKLWDEKKDTAWAAEIDAEIDAALKKAAAAPPPNKSQIFDNVFAQLTPRQEQQRKELMGEA